MAKQVLVVANETLGGRALVDAVKQRHQQGDAEFIVISPQNRLKEGYITYDEAVYSAAKHRVEHTVHELRVAGIQAQGKVADPNPYRSIEDALEDFDINEIIISTHPQTRSGWLRRRLIDRVRHDFGLPVKHVVVDLENEPRDTTYTLIVATQTSHLQTLIRKLKDRTQRANHRFVLVVSPESGDQQHMHNAHDHLRRLLDHLHHHRLSVAGHLGDPDLYRAIMHALHVQKVDEIIIVAPRHTSSGWLRTDLVERVRSHTDIPVEHVIPDPASDLQRV